MAKHRLLTLSVVVLSAAGFLYWLFAAGLRAPVPRMECVLASRGLIPDGDSPFPSIGEQEPIRGADKAPVTLIVYYDLQCPHCARLEQSLEQLLIDYPEDLRLVYRHYPLGTLHDKAFLAAQAVEAAGAQGQRWSMQKRLFAEQGLWEEAGPQQFDAYLAQQAAALGLDVERFGTDLVSETTQAAVMQAYDQAVEIGLARTPTVVINGQYYEGPVDEWTLAAYIEMLLLEARHHQACPPMEISASVQYTATLHTTQGDIRIRLLPEQAPLAVNNFVYLARQGWYDGVPFHRVIPGFVTQTGDPSGTGLGGPGYTFADEIATRTRFDRAGLVGMAHPEPDQNGSQFFVTYAAQPSLDGKYTLFGEVISGMEAAQRFAVRDPATNTAGMREPDRIISVTIETSQDK